MLNSICLIYMVSICYILCFPLEIYMFWLNKENIDRPIFHMGYSAISPGALALETCPEISVMVWCKDPRHECIYAHVFFYPKCKIYRIIRSINLRFQSPKRNHLSPKNGHLTTSKGYLYHLNRVVLKNLGNTNTGGSAFQWDAMAHLL